MDSAKVYFVHRVKVYKKHFDGTPTEVLYCETIRGDYATCVDYAIKKMVELEGNKILVTPIQEFKWKQKQSKEVHSDSSL